MHIYLSSSHNPYVNIATEEYFIRNRQSEILFLYRNTPSIIVGKHQNAFSEINLALATQHNIDVVRRLSGGGAVFHDLGNLNYAHIKSVDNNNKVDFSRFLSPLVDALHAFGAPVETGPRNNLLLDGKKITGTACHTIKNRVMHHGTLLFNANLDMLTRVLTPHNKTFESKAVKSVSSTVTNINNHLTEKTGIEDFENFMVDFFIKKGYQPLSINDAQHDIENLVKDRYQKWEWNFGYSPKFTFQTKNYSVWVEKGIITKIHSRFGNTSVWSEDLIGQRFSEETLTRYNLT